MFDDRKIAINIKDLGYKYLNSDDWALKEINLMVPQGSLLALVGPSGCGKSTLLTLLRGFQQEIGGDLTGKIKIFQKDISQVSISKLGSEIGIVFQNPALQLHQLSVIDEVASSLMYRGRPYDECLEKAKKLIDRFLGPEFYNRCPNELSGGQQQKVALAASLTLDAKILLLDEPFSFLDERSDNELIDLLQELHKQGTTIIVATHDIPQIAKVATQMVLMSEGEIIANDFPQKIIDSAVFKKTFPPPFPVKTVFHKKSSEILRLDNISYFYPDSQNGVKDINLTINQGQILGLIGANGSGKSTLAKIILGLIKPQQGHIFLNQKDITNLAVETRAKTIGYLTQDPSDMFFESTLFEEVSAGPKFFDQPVSPKKIEDILKQFNLWQYHNKHPDSISGGEKSRLALTDILINNTSILILDEPEFGLDPKNWQEIIFTLKKLRNLGKTIIVISQDLKSMHSLCDRLVVMKNGIIQPS